MAKRPIEDSFEKRPNWITEHIPPELAKSTLFSFNIKLTTGGTITVDLLQDIDIEYDRLEQQLEETPSQYVWYATVLAELKSRVHTLERKCKGRRGVLTAEAVELGRDSGYRPTAEQIKAIIEHDAILDKMEAQLAQGQMHANKMHHMVEALRMKSEHLRSLAGFKRQERETQR